MQLLNTIAGYPAFKKTGSSVRLMRGFTVIILLLFASELQAQFGGSYTYAYLNLPISARIAALSGLNITTFDDDPSFSYQNPAMLNETMDGRVRVSNAFMPTGINSGSITYATYAEKMNFTMGGGLVYRSYGKFEMNDLNGDRIGTFSAGEYAMYWGASYSANKLRYGANIKLLYSQLESYNSFGAAIDLGAAYVDTSQRLCIALVFRNAGTQFDPYTDENREQLPFQIDFGVSKRLEHLPLRLSFTLHDLQTFDIRYDDPGIRQDVNIFGADSTSTEKKYTIDKIARHLNIGGEFYFGKNVMARVGYDHMKRKELSIETLRGMTGFSLGFGIQIKRFQFDYSHEFYSIAGGSNMISLGTNLNSW